jgi:hypothetical protein
MRSRLLAPGIALAALLADALGLHGVAAWLLLLSLPAAAATAFIAISDALEGRARWLGGNTAALALALLVLGSAVRENAARGASVPAFAVSAVVTALVIYAVPVLLWILEPLRPGARAASAS